MTIKTDDRTVDIASQGIDVGQNVAGGVLSFFLPSSVAVQFSAAVGGAARLAGQAITGKKFSTSIAQVRTVMPDGQIKMAPPTGGGGGQYPPDAKLKTAPSKAGTGKASASKPDEKVDIQKDLAKVETESVSPEDIKIDDKRDYKVDLPVNKDHDDIDMSSLGTSGKEDSDFENKLADNNFAGDQGINPASDVGGDFGADSGGEPD